MALEGKPKFFLVKVTGGQEESIAKIAEVRVRNSNGAIKVKSILIPPGSKGMLIVEADSYSDVLNAFEGIKYFKRILPGIVDVKEIEQLLITEKEIVLNIGDLVEIVAGPFKGMTAKVINIRSENEVVIQLQGASISPIPIVIPKDNLKKIETG
ncbi:transcription elongation factor Spt5 [Candidatus Geothermarchaeota archaeon]|nr:MAG: transcription elongation factor Spt5 [Candidatus Geothermarchaeota archaeon]RLG62868.1 MAG: transcription elongation factor Spt5 [Candidatus Geothermarchaeota archaeon]HEW93943.1 transcription elongation factor Spt5 [Thermoprotei archaeon]